MAEKNYDILVIGGGVIGLSIARELHRRGARRIAVVERGRCGREASWAAGGMLSPQVEANEKDSFLDLCCASRDLYPQFAEEVLDETGVDIELDRTGTIYLAFSDEERLVLDERYRWQRAAGFGVELLSGEDLRKAEPEISPRAQAGVHFVNDWQVENRKLLLALLKYAEQSGIDVIENTPVTDVKIASGRVTGAATAAGRIAGDAVIIATGAWTSLITLGDAAMPVTIKPVKGQIVVYKAGAGQFRHVIYSSRGYVVPRRDGRLLVGATSENAGFDKATTTDAAERLHKAAIEIAPRLSEYEVIDQWSGLRPCSGDELPVLGDIPGAEGLMIATGHYRNGILLAPMTARLIADKLIRGQAAEELTTFGPQRSVSAAA